MTGATRAQTWIAGGVVVAIVATIAGFALTRGHHERSAPTTRAPASTTTRAPAARPRGVIAPLTGVRDPTSGAAHRPALSIKIDNVQAAHPQTGLDQADVVYEEVVEAGYTRLLAIFQSHVPTVVGPIRSVRRTDQGIVTPVGGLFAYSGGAQYAISSIRTAPVTLIDETRAGSAMFRDHSRSAPHNLYGHPAALFAFGGTPVPPPHLFTYRAAHQAVGGVAVTHASVGFGSGFAVSYVWDAPHQSWDRSIFGRADLLTSGVQEAPRNVVVMFVQYAGGVGVIGAEAVTVGSGDAIVFTAGHEVTGRWTRPTRGHAPQFVDRAGVPVRLTPGQTWVELAPVGTPVTGS